MGNRVLMQVWSSKTPKNWEGKNNVSPVVYMHWGGSNWREITDRLRIRMKERGDDVAYWGARLVQEASKDRNIENDSMSFGLWNAEKKLTGEDSHGDNGVILIDAATGQVEQLNRKY